MVVDSSVWIEILREGPLQKDCHKAFHRQTLRVPTLVLLEVYKKLKSKASEDVALEAVAFLSQYQVLDMTREIAILAADLCLQRQIPMADSIVLAHAEYLGETLLTLDNDFADIPNVKVIR